MNVSTTTWLITLAGLCLLLGVDLFLAVRRPREVSLREAGLWIGFYAGLAVAFGLGLLAFSGPRASGEFFAGWLTEYSLSVDNLFVFVILLSRFAVPRKQQQEALLIGIVLALVLRGVFIGVGAAAIERFVWIFYLFGAFLIYTAIRLATAGETDAADFKENALLRLMRRVLPTTPEFAGASLVVRQGGRRLATPMLVVIVAIGTTDLLFALDSIPAIFGLTKEPYIVFTANAFALMGLRQLYFLLGGLLDRLVYLGIGLAVVLGFIGVKLILEALHGNNLPFLNGGEEISSVPEIPIWLSLVVIVATLLVTTAASLFKTRREARMRAASDPDSPSRPAHRAGAA